MAAQLLPPPVPKRRLPRGLAKRNPSGAIIRGCWGCSNQQGLYPNSKLVFQKDLRKFWWFNWCNAPFQLGVSAMKQTWDVRPKQCWEFLGCYYLEEWEAQICLLLAFH